ncbi:MAG: DUF2283 domain-containing protein [Rubrivivax sp.]
MHSWVRIEAGPVADSDEVRPGVVLDFDEQGRVIGIEMVSASKQVGNPREMAFEVLGATQH